ncbi:MAG: thioredoxin [Clostridiaceae bacterium]|jgi:thioredoxin 1|nr:thioredoxin [Clostridiaceae bacterium]
MKQYKGEIIMGNVLDLTKDNFDKEVLQSDKPVLVDFWAAWCGPCRMVAPIIEQVAEEFQGKAKVAKINVDEQSELAQQYRIMSIPTLIVFKDGKIAESVVGAKSKNDLSNMLNKYI